MMIDVLEVKMILSDTLSGQACVFLVVVLLMREVEIQAWYMDIDI